VTRLESRTPTLKLLLTPLLVTAMLAAIYAYINSTPATLNEQGVLTRDFLQSRLVRHVEIVAIAFAIAALIGLPVGVLLTRVPRPLRIPALAVASLGQAVPSVAVLALAFTVTGLGVKPTVFALVVYALLPILRNTIVGLEGVDRAAVEAARGMGMTAWQSLRRVQLPLASPIIVAGLRTSLVLVVGTATLGNFIGGGGLGDVIDSGLTADPVSGPRIVLVGTGMVAGLALLLDWGMGLAARAVVPESLTERRRSAE